jgi:hypothetical protein
MPTSFNLQTLARRLATAWTDFRRPRQKPRQGLKNSSRQSGLEVLELRQLLTTFTVTTLSDTVDANDGMTSFREAVTAANALNDPDTIEFSPTLIGTVGFTLGEMNITGPVAIQGNGAAQTVLDAQGASRLFTIFPNSGDVSFDGLTLTGGKTTNGVARGGAIYSATQGTLTLTNSLVTGNSTQGSLANGGAIFSRAASPIVIVNSEITHNSTAGENANGGAISDYLGGTLTVIDSQVSYNTTTGQNSSGGGINWQQGEVLIDGSTVGHNSTQADGAHGGGLSVRLASLTVSNSSVLMNSTAGNVGIGGGIYAYNGAVVITGSHVERNRTGGTNSAGGGLYSLQGPVTLTNSTVVNNQTTGDTSRGGGIRVNSGDVTLQNSTVSGNTTLGNMSPGGGISTGYAFGSNTLSILSSTISGNTASGVSGSGGGIDMYNGNLNVVNSTISGNSSSDRGGGISAENVPVSLTNATVAFNSSSSVTNYSAGGIFASLGNLTINNSIVAKNVNSIATDLSPGIGTLSINNSLIGSNFGTALKASAVPNAFGNLIGTDSVPIDPILGPLAFNYGAITQTHALLSSVAINGGSNALAAAAGLSVDQAGQPRFDGGTVDMGALEYQTPVVSFSTDMAFVSESVGTYLVTVNLSAASALPVTVPFTIDPNSTASDPSDYTISASPLVIPAGATSGTIKISVVNSAGFEPDESVLLDFGTLTNGTPGLFSTTTVIIVDGSTPPVAAFNIAQQSAGEGAGTVTLTVNLNYAFGQDVSIPFSIKGTAASPADFTVNTSPLIIPAGSTSGTITLNVVDDALIEGDETVVVTLSAPINATLGAVDTETVTLQDNDFNTAPVVPAKQAFNVPENSPIGTVVGVLTASDSDLPAPFNTLTYSLTSNPGNAFAINSQTGEITVADPTSLDFETSPLILVGVLVSDGGTPALSTNQSITIHLTDVDDPPLIPSNQTFVIPENSSNSTIVGSVVASDYDTLPLFNTLTYSLGTNPNNAFAINPLNGQLTVANQAALDFEVTHQIVIGVTVTDGGNATTTQNVTVHLNDVNENPTIPAGQAFSIPENSSFSTVIGTVTASDPDTAAPFMTLTFSLTGNPGNACAIDPVTGQLTVLTPAALNFESANSLIVTVKVQDGGGLSFSQNVTLNVTDVNEAPSIPANQTFSIPENSATGVVVGTVAKSDPDTTAPFKTLTFSLTSNPGNAFAINAQTGQITVANSAPLDFETSASLVLGVKVTDGGNLTATQNVTVNLTNVNEAPSILANQAFPLPENSIAGVVVGTVVASDPDTTAPFKTLTYSLSNNPSNAFAVNAATGQITVANVASLDFETNPSIVLGVTVTDGGNLSALQNVTVNLTNVNEAPTITANQAFSIPENSVAGVVVGTVVASDPDTTVPFKTLTFSLTSNPNNAFAIDPATGQLTVANPAILDFETTSAFVLGVQATDGGNLSATQDVTINLSDVNEIPVLAANQTFSIPENSPIGFAIGTVAATDVDTTVPFNTLTYSLSNNPSNAFAIDAVTGQLTVANSASLNFETTPSFVIGVTVTDGGNLAATQDVTVNLTDVNEAPVIAANQTFNLPENSAVNVSVGTVAASDVDASAPFNTRTFSLSTNPGNAFAINAATGQITVANAAPLDFETTTSFLVGVTVTDGGNLATTQNVTVNLTNVNESPVIPANQSFSIPENSAAGFIVGTVNASDVDTSAPFNTLTFSLSGNPSNAFSINAQTGQITVANATLLDFETTPAFTLGVTVQDGGNLSVSQNVKVNLTNVNEAPVITANQAFSIPEHSAANFVVGAVAASDPENSSLTFEIVSGSPANPFTINATTGQISVSSPAAELEFSTTPVFTLQVKVTDSGNVSTTASVQVNLTEVTGPPVISGGSGTVTFVKKHPAVGLMPNITLTAPEGATSLGRVEVSYLIPKKGLLTDVAFSNASSLGQVTESGPTTFKKAAGTHKLTIDLNPSTTVAEVEAFLRSFTFSTKKFDAKTSNLGRKIDVQVFDRQGAGTPSNLVTTQIRAKTK